MTFKSLLEKLVQFFIKLRRPKTTKTQKITTIKLNKTPSSNKISQRELLDVQIKQVEHKQQTTIAQFFEKPSDPVIQFPPTIITVGSESIPELEPGYVFETCPLIDCEDYLEILERGLRGMMDKLPSKPVYVLTTSEIEFGGKKCPKNYNEKMLQQTGKNVRNTGRPRNFNDILVKLPKSFAAPVYFVDVENSLEIQQLAKTLLPKFEKFGLHGKFDDIFLAFTKFTKSTIVTSDKHLIFSHVQAQCEKPINFQEFLEKLMQPSPITVMLRERRNYYRHNPGWKAKR